MKSVGQRIESLDYIKGVACLIVAYNHFKNIYPLRVTGIFGEYVIRFFTNGGYMVYIFLGISFYLAAVKYYRTADYRWGENVKKRYVSLLLPVLSMYVLVFLLNKADAFRLYEKVTEITGGGDPAIHYPIDDSLKKMMAVGVLKTLISGSSDYIFTFWMLNRVVKGFLITLIISAIMKENKIKQACFYAVIFLAIIYVNYDIIYTMCPILSFIAYWFCKAEKEKKNYWTEYMGGGILAIGLLFSLIPGKYSFMYIPGSILVIVGAVMANNKIKFSMRKLSYLSRISIEIYFIHQPITTTICAAIFLLLNRVNVISPNIKIVVLAILYFFILVLISYFIKWGKNRLRNFIAYYRKDSFA